MDIPKDASDEHTACVECSPKCLATRVPILPYGPERKNSWLKMPTATGT